MKKTLLIATMIAGSVFANAQTANTTVTPNQTAQSTQTTVADAATRAKSMTQKMTKALTLTTDQATKVSAINLDRAKSMDLVKQKTEGYTQEGVLAKWNTAITAILTADQLTKFKKMLADQAAKK
jgi:hypothetical protein